LIIRIIVKIIAIRSHILRLKCTKFDSGWNSVTDTTGGAYSAPHILQLGLRGLLLREESGGKGREGRGGDTANWGRERKKGE